MCSLASGLLMIFIKILNRKFQYDTIDLILEMLNMVYLYSFFDI